jgi:uncharacterized protein (DUF305 family)
MPILVNKGGVITIIYLKPMKFKLCLMSVLLFMLSSRQSFAQKMTMDMSGQNNTHSVFLTMMDEMMQKMDHSPRGKSTGEEFLLQMIPHHEGAIAMANYEIKHGKSMEMVRLAKSIVAEQQIEISQMRLWLKQTVSTDTVMSEKFIASMNRSMDAMMRHLPAGKALNDIDEAFAKVMVPHHQAAIDMAKELLTAPSDSKTTAFAKGLISAEQIEIEQMNAFLK